MILTIVLILACIVSAIFFGAAIVVGGAGAILYFGDFIVFGLIVWGVAHLITKKKKGA